MRQHINTRDRDFDYILDENASESEFYENIGKTLLKIDAPNFIEVSGDFGTAKYDVKQRGTFMKNGRKCPSMYVVETENDISGLTPSTYDEVYLTCVNVEGNNYKFYHMIPGTLGIDAIYGRIGSQQGDLYAPKRLNEPYKNRMYWIRFYEKLGKGYVDSSKQYLGKQIKKEKSNVIKDTTQNSLFEKLLMFSKHIVNENLVSDAVTKEQVKEARRIYKAMSNRTTVKGFNTQLQKLIAVSPRSTRYVSSLMATAKDDFEYILSREDDLINSMEAVLMGEEVVKENTPFGNIVVSEITDEEKESIEKMLSNTLKPKVRKMYKVCSPQQDKKFEKYCKDNSIKNTKRLWHGSRNCNWLSIIKNGLLINSGAIRTGSMFGKRIYFAPSSMKSFGYTSSKEAKWNNESSSSAFMGVYEVAYGKPLMTMKRGYSYTENEVRTQGYDCVHATPENTGLYNDEIIFYNEAAMRMRYLVEFTA